jgi:hypothetical protein
MLTVVNSLHKKLSTALEHLRINLIYFCGETYILASNLVWEEFTAGDLNSDMQNNTGPRTFYKSVISLSSEIKLVSP